MKIISFAIVLTSLLVSTSAVANSKYIDVLTRACEGGYACKNSNYDLLELDSGSASKCTPRTQQEACRELEQYRQQKKLQDDLMFDMMMMR